MPCIAIEKVYLYKIVAKGVSVRSPTLIIAQWSKMIKFLTEYSFQNVVIISSICIVHIISKPISKIDITFF